MGCLCVTREILPRISLLWKEKTAFFPHKHLFLLEWPLFHPVVGNNLWNCLKTPTLVEISNIFQGWKKIRSQILLSLHLSVPDISRLQKLAKNNLVKDQSTFQVQPNTTPLHVESRGPWYWTPPVSCHCWKHSWKWHMTSKHMKSNIPVYFPFPPLTHRI